MAVMNTTRMGTTSTPSIAASSGPSPLPSGGPSGGMSPGPNSMGGGAGPSPGGPGMGGGGGGGGMGPGGMSGPGSVGSVGSGMGIGPGGMVGTPGGGMSPSAAAPSPLGQVGGLGSPHGPAGMSGMKQESQPPPPNVMQALKQVRPWWSWVKMWWDLVFLNGGFDSYSAGSGGGRTTTGTARKLRQGTPGWGSDATAGDAAGDCCRRSHGWRRRSWAHGWRWSPATATGRRSWTDGWPRRAGSWRCGGRRSERDGPAGSVGQPEVSECRRCPAEPRRNAAKSARHDAAGTGAGAAATESDAGGKFWGFVCLFRDLFANFMGYLHRA